MSKAMKATFTLKDVEKHYDRLVDYDDINDVTPAHNCRFIDGLAMSSIKDGAHVLNLLCRSGKVEEYYHQKRKNLSFVSVDVSKRLLKVAENRFKKSGVKSKTFQLTSLSLPWKNSTFDNITSYETLEHLPDPGKIINEFFRVLKPGGELILSTPNTSWDWIHSFVAFLGIHHPEGPHRFIPRGEIIFLLKKAGFSITKEKTVILVPVGPKIIRKLGDIAETIMGEPVRRHIALRRYFVCRKGMVTLPPLTDR